MRPLGQSHEGSRDAAEELAARERLDNTFPCPEGLVPLMSGGRRAMDPDGKPACQVKRSFVKGELTNLGSDKLVVADSRFGLRMGYARLDGNNYFALQPEVDLHFGSGVALGLGVPLNVLAYPQGFYDTGKIKLRKHDYDKESDYARILRFFTVGRKEDQFYLNVSQLVAASIGHGAIVRRYSGNTDQNITRVGAQLDAYGKYGGFEAFVGDVVQPQHFVAGLAFVKPLGFLSGDLGNTLGQTSLGLSTAVDFSAPYTLSRVANKYPEVADDGEPIVLESRRAQVVGADLETKVLKTEAADIKIFGDYSRLLDVSPPTGAGANGQGGGGFTLGTLGRFNAGDVKLHAFRVVLEGRYFDGNYVPGYFDTFYEVQKYQFITGKADTGYEPKLRTILARDPAHKRAGYYVEAAYQYNGGLALSAAFEDSFQPDLAPRVSGILVAAVLRLLLPAQLRGAAHQLGQRARRRQHAHLRGGAPAPLAHPLFQRAHLPQLARGPGAGRDEERVRRRLRSRARLRVRPQPARESVGRFSQNPPAPGPNYGARPSSSGSVAPWVCSPSQPALASNHSRAHHDQTALPSRSACVALQSTT
jgi:hypothetical protein